MTIQHASILLLAVAAAFGCRARDPDAAGLLDVGDDEPAAPAADAPADAGRWTIACTPTGAGAEDAPPPTYRFEVAGALDPLDEAQPLVVTVARVAGGAAAPVALASAERGRGAVSAAGPLFVGFESGVLTASPAPGGAHTGVTTLARDDEARALAVTCAVVRGG